MRGEFSKFLEQHHDGKIHKREFKKMLEQVFFFTRVHLKDSTILQMTVQTLPGQDATCMQKHIFRCYDENENGYIDFVEFMVRPQLCITKEPIQLVFHIMSDGTAEEALRRIFRVFDINGDGQITEKELKRLVKDMFKLVKEEAPEEVDYLQIQKEVTICKIGVWVEY